MGCSTGIAWFWHRKKLFSQALSFHLCSRAERSLGAKNVMCSLSKSLKYVFLKKHPRNFNWKLYLCLPEKKGKKQPAFWTAISDNKFTIWHIKLTIYNQSPALWEKLQFGQFCFFINFPFLTISKTMTNSCVQLCYRFATLFRVRGGILNTLLKFP